MIYVLDTSFFIICNNYYIKVFPTFWYKLDESVKGKKIISVKQTKKEIDDYQGKKDQIEPWIKNNSHIFPELELEDSNNLIKIFSTENFYEIIRKKEILKNKNTADPYLIAKAMSLKDAGEEPCVVTNEMHAKEYGPEKNKGLIKIPDICDYFGIRCIFVQDFMVEMKWKF